MLLTKTGSGASVWPMARSAMPRTVVMRVGLLLSVLISGSLATRMAVSMISPGVGVFTTITALALALAGRAPTVQVIVPALLAQLMPVGVSEMNCTPEGRMLVRNTPVKAVRPLLFT